MAVGKQLSNRFFLFYLFNRKSILFNFIQNVLREKKIEKKDKS